MLALLVEGIHAINTELVRTRHPLPLAHVVGRQPTQVTDPVHRPDDVTLEHVRSDDERTFVRSSRPGRIDTEHSTLRAIRTSERLDERVLATAIAEPGREQIRHMPEVLDHPVRTDTLEQLRALASTHLSLPDILTERRIVLRDTLRRLQPDVQREHRTIAAVRDEPGTIRIRRAIADERRRRHIQHLLGQLRRGLIQRLTSAHTIDPRELIHAARNGLGLRETRIRDRLDGILREHILIPGFPRTLRADGQLLKIHTQERLDTMVESQVVLTQQRTLERETLRTPSDRVVTNWNVVVRHIASATVITSGNAGRERDGRPSLSRSRLDAGRGERSLRQTSTLRILATLDEVEPHRTIRRALIDILCKRLRSHRKGIKHIGTSHNENYFLRLPLFGGPSIHHPMDRYPPTITVARGLSSPLRRSHPMTNRMQSLRSMDGWMIRIHYSVNKIVAIA